MTHLDVINHYASLIEAKSYLEIGVCNPRDNFDRVNIAHKVGVDPAPVQERETLYKLQSDLFFAQNREKFDLVFVDGFHECHQVEKDIANAFACLNKGGIVVVHDVAPHNEWLTRPYSQYREGEPWCGDGWKAVYRALSGGKIGGTVYTFDYGVAVLSVKKRASKPVELPEPLNYKEHYQTYLNTYGVAQL